MHAPMTDAELREVAEDADFPTEVARVILRAEMLRRGMEAPTETNWDLGKAEPPAAKPVIVARYRDLHLATVMNSLLDSAGIEGFLADGTMIRLDWLIERTRRYQGVDAEQQCQGSAGAAGGRYP